jgi:hypothetical protein
MTSDRRRYQREVERLLEQIRERVRELRLLKVRGARGPALAESKRDLMQARKELAALVAASSH